jgi:hypothetical protein
LRRRRYARRCSGGWPNALGVIATAAIGDTSAQRCACSNVNTLFQQQATAREMPEDRVPVDPGIDAPRPTAKDMSMSDYGES